MKRRLLDRLRPAPPPAERNELATDPPATAKEAQELIVMLAHTALELKARVATLEAKQGGDGFEAELEKRIGALEQRVAGLQSNVNEVVDQSSETSVAAPTDLEEIEALRAAKRAKRTARVQAARERTKKKVPKGGAE